MSMWNSFSQSQKQIYITLCSIFSPRFLLYWNESMKKQDIWFEKLVVISPMCNIIIDILSIFTSITPFWQLQKDLLVICFVYIESSTSLPHSRTFLPIILVYISHFPTHWTLFFLSFIYPIKFFSVVLETEIASVQREICGYIVGFTNSNWKYINQCILPSLPFCFSHPFRTRFPRHRNHRVLW